MVGIYWPGLQCLNPVGSNPMVGLGLTVHCNGIGVNSANSPQQGRRNGGDCCRSKRGGREGGQKSATPRGLLPRHKRRREEEENTSPPHPPQHTIFKACTVLYGAVRCCEGGLEERGPLRLIDGSILRPEVKTANKENKEEHTA